MVSSHFCHCAPAESVFKLPAAYWDLKCPGKPQAVRPMLLDLGQGCGGTGKGTGTQAGTGTGTGTTAESGSSGKGPPLTFLEAFGREVGIFGALSSGDTSGSLADPNGSRYGVPNGTSVDGFNFLWLQIVYGTMESVSSPIKSSKGFVKTIADAWKKKARLWIPKPDHLPMEVVDDLLKTHGKSMAPSMHQLKTIMPYSRALEFTKEWRGVYQAHHILEVDMIGKFKMGSAEHAPAIILKKEEHQQFTNALNAARAAWRPPYRGAKFGKDDLWKIYQTVYRDHPHWLEAIKSYFGK